MSATVPWKAFGLTVAALGLVIAAWIVFGNVGATGLTVREPIPSPSNPCEREYLRWLQTADRSAGGERLTAQRLEPFFDACSMAELQTAGGKYPILKCTPNEFAPCDPTGYEPIFDWDAPWAQRLCQSAPDVLDSRICIETDGDGEVQTSVIINVTDRPIIVFIDHPDRPETVMMRLQPGESGTADFGSADEQCSAAPLIARTRSGVEVARREMLCGPAGWLIQEE